jgi:hypothetical protein
VALQSPLRFGIHLVKTKVQDRLGQTRSPEPLNYKRLDALQEVFFFLDEHGQNSKQLC